MDCCSEVGCYGCIGGMKWNWTAWELELNGSWSFPGVIGLALTTRRADICGDDWTEELKYAVLKYPVCLGNMSISASLKKTDGDSEKKKKRDICKDRSTNLSLQSTPILRYKTWGTWYCWNYTNVNSSLVPFGSIHIRFNTSCKELPSVYLEHIGNTGRTWKKSMEIFYIQWNTLQNWKLCNYFSFWRYKKDLWLKKKLVWASHENQGWHVSYPVEMRKAPNSRFHLNPPDNFSSNGRI